MTLPPEEPLVEFPAHEISAAARAFVRAIGASADFPAFVGNVRAISRTAGDMEARIALLQDAIVQDVALTAKILRIANSVMAPSGGGSVSSVKQAILLLGFDRVRHLAMAASVFDHLQRKAPAVGELLTVSVLTANQCLHLAPAAGYHKVEVAYLCGLFRNLGEILVACYRAKQYETWLAVLARDPKAGVGAEEKVIGFSFAHAGMALAQRWKMPAEIVGTMRHANTPSGSVDGRLHAITQMSADVTNAVYRRRTGERPGVLANIVARYTHALGLDTAAVVSSAKAALADSQAALTTMNATFDEARLSRQIEISAIAMSEPVQHDALDVGSPDSAPREWVDEWEPNLPRSAADPDWVAPAGHYEPNANDTAAEARTRMALSRMNDDRLDDAFDVGMATQATLDAICGAGYRRAVLALSSEDFTRVRGRMGVGMGHDDAVRMFLVRIASTGGPFGAALLARENLFVDMDTDDAKALRRDRLIRDLDPRSFGLLPLVIEDKMLGCLYFDDAAQRVEATPALQTLLKELRDHLVAALARHRRNTNAMTSS